MLNIKPVSELRNYSVLLSEVAADAPVYLTKNGYGSYAISTLEEYETYKRKAAEYDRTAAELRLLNELMVGRRSGDEQGWIPAEDVRAHFEGMQDGV